MSSNVLTILALAGVLLVAALLAGQTQQQLQAIPQLQHRVRALEQWRMTLEESCRDTTPAQD